MPNLTTTTRSHHPAACPRELCTARPERAPAHRLLQAPPRQEQPGPLREDTGPPDESLVGEVLRLYDEEDFTYQGIARTLGISARQAERIIDTVYHQRAAELARGVSHIDNAIVRRMYERKHNNEGFTLTDLARLAGYSGESRVKRLLGLAETASTKKKLSDGTIKEYPGRVLDTISVDDAGRMVRAMGVLPCEVADL